MCLLWGIPYLFIKVAVEEVSVPVVVFARLTGGTERLSPRRWAGLVIGLGGVALLAAPDLGGGNGLAVAEVLLVALGYATAPLIAARKLADVPALPMTAACLSLGAVGSLAALGVICTACAFLVFLALIREAGTSRAMVFTYVNPAVAVAAGVVFLSEPFTVTVAASFALILAGSLLATWTARAPDSPADQAGLVPVSRRRPPRLRSRSSDPASPAR